MQANPRTLRRIFEGHRQYLVPLFQRPYVWQEELQWQPLWEDIRSLGESSEPGEDGHPHFLGAIVLEQMLRPTGDIEKRFIIDGQQRLTTIQIIFEAFADLCAELEETKHHTALRQLTRNDDPLSNNEDDQFKVWPTNADQAHFRRVILAESSAHLLKDYGFRSNRTWINHPIADCYLFFYRAIKEWLTDVEDGQSVGTPVSTLYQVLCQNMRLVVIDLDHTDDPQLIFETLNARGTPLLPADLVKNHLFLRAEREGEKIKELYDKTWAVFDDEQSYWRAEVGRGHSKRARVDTFLQHYLAAKTGKDTPVSHLYAGFRRRSDTLFDSAAEQLGSIQEYGKIYKGFGGFDEGSPEQDFFARLDTMDVTTAYPFLLELFARFGDDPSVVRPVLRDIETFLVRRLVCQLNTRGYNRLFLDLISTLDGEVGEVPKQVRGELLKSQAEYGRWPPDTEFRKAWMEDPLYERLARTRLNMILCALEEQLRSSLGETLVLRTSLTIEHILPQDWEANWPLGNEITKEDRDISLHTIGNLTLVSQRLNPALSNSAWAEKRRFLKENSQLNLNKHLLNEPTWETCWDESSIQDRGKHLSQTAQEIWPYPS